MRRICRYGPSCSTAGPVPVLFFCLVLAAIVAVSSGFAAARAAGEAERSPHELIPLLRDGGLIIYLRHAATDHRESDSDISDLSRCDLQRNLSDQGRQEAAETDKAIRALGIPIGAVYASPYCRTIDTAGLVFGRYEVLDGLRATFFTDAEETARLAAFLRERLSQPPPAGGNTVLVGHSANLSDVTAIWPRPEGVAHVFRPLGDGGFEHLGRIVPTDWQNLVAKR